MQVIIHFIYIFGLNCLLLTKKPAIFLVWRQSDS